MMNLKSEDDRYKYFYSYSHSQMDSDLVAHRKYFSVAKRGFGEDAFHAMWFKLLTEFRPSNMLEIGVYRGQTISLWKLIASKINLDCDVWGISPLTSIGDEVSSYDSINYQEDIVENFRKFNLSDPNILKALSQDVSAIEFVKSRNWDVIYIDGSHDYKDVVADVELAISSLSPGGILVMDDSSAYSEFNPPFFAFAGHEGPSKVASEIESTKVLTLLGTCGHNRVYQAIS